MDNRNLSRSGNKYAEGEHYALGSEIYEATFNVALDLWILQQLNEPRFLAVEESGDLTELQFNRADGSFQRIGPAGRDSSALTLFSGNVSYEQRVRPSDEPRKAAGCMRWLFLGIGALLTYFVCNVTIVLGAMAALRAMGIDVQNAIGWYYIVVYTGGTFVGVPSMLFYAIAFGIIHGRTANQGSAPGLVAVSGHVVAALAVTVLAAFTVGFCWMLFFRRQRPAQLPACAVGTRSQARSRAPL